MKIIAKIASRVENLMLKNWVNPFMTFWVNFRWLSINQAVKFPIYVYGRSKIMGGKILINSAIRRGIIRINQTYPWAPGIMDNQTTLINTGTIIFDGACIIGTGNKIVVNQNGTLRLGNNARISDNISSVVQTLFQSDVKQE